jgi:Putative Ig domain
MSFAPVARTALLYALALALAPLSLSSTAYAETSRWAPIITGWPATTVTLPNTYSFQPTLTERAATWTHFEIAHKPTWAQFDPATGHLWGTPTRAGTDPEIVISAVNWYGSAALPAFSITASGGSQQTTPPTVSTPPTISGNPITSVSVGATYQFTPTASDSNHGTMKFSIQNKPEWATFNTTSGSLMGTPGAADVGTYAKIVISVSDGTKSTSLPAFTVAVNQIATGNTTLDWTPPTENTNNTPLQNLAGYRVHYGTSASSLTQTVSITNPGVTSYVFDNLSPGTWYFAMTAYTTSGTESSLSGVISTSIQ